MMVLALCLFAAADLREQALAARLARDFPDPAASYLLIDARTRAAVASRWDLPGLPIPVGSLVKPFLAAADRGPAFHADCRTCWKPAGHGRITMPQALAESCNSYFLEVARRIDARDLERLGLPEPPADPGSRIGLGAGWKIAPEALIRAYAALEDPGVRAALRIAARSGTAQSVRAPALAKTGTAPCTAERRHAGDGFAAVLFPDPAPRYALLVRLHNAPGSQAAALAGRMIRAVLESR